MVDKYNATTDRFDKLLRQVADERNRLNQDINTTNTDYLQVMNDSDRLTNQVNHSGLEVAHLQREYDIYTIECS